jgi:hypothetical protein
MHEPEMPEAMREDLRDYPEPLTLDQVIGGLQALREKFGGDVPVVTPGYEPVTDVRFHLPVGFAQPVVVVADANTFDDEE